MSDVSTRIGIYNELDHETGKIPKVPIVLKVFGVCILLITITVFICWKVVS